MKRRPHADPVTPELRAEVLERDHFTCVAWLLGASGCKEPLTLDHVQPGYGRMGRRAPSDRAHLVTLCAFHHLETSWATSHRPELRDYLAAEPGATIDWTAAYEDCDGGSDER